jgi:hypothetical protein
VVTVAAAGAVIEAAGIADAAATCGTNDAEIATLATRPISMTDTIDRNGKRTPQCELVSRAGQARPRPPDTAWATTDTRLVPIKEDKSDPGTLEEDNIRPLYWVPRRDETHRMLRSVGMKT